MDSIMYLELKECYNQIAEIENEEQRKRGRGLLANTVRKMLYLSEVLRKEGKLALEEEAYLLDDTDIKEFLKTLIFYVVDEVSPEVIREIGISQCISSELRDFDKLNYLVVLQGILFMCEGDNPRILKEKLLSLLPRDAVSLYDLIEDETFKGMLLKQREQEQDDIPGAHLSNAFFYEEFPVSREDKNYLPLKTLDDVICAIGGRDIQRLLRDVSNYQIAAVFKNVSGEARRRLCSNLSKHLVALIMEELFLVESAEEDWIFDETMHVFRVLVGLIDSGEIECTDQRIRQLLQSVLDEE